MRVTYLISKTNADGKTALEISTKEEVREILKQNKGLSIDKRRNFIADFINDGNEIDCMIYEAPLDAYREHCKQHIASERNRKSKKQYHHVRLDSMLSYDDNGCIGDILADEINIENNVVSTAVSRRANPRTSVQTSNGERRKVPRKAMFHSITTTSSATENARTVNPKSYPKNPKRYD